MMKYAQMAALAGILTGGSVLACQAADTSGGSGTIRYAQMNSPGDGLDKEAASEGNARPSKRAVPQRKKSGKRMR
ncbi:hypothetical protein [Methylobacterium haplocladii]|uniref:Lipoprotein n=1 Tax=Methylobacterium haplocladii TaxID=1176176 RepID=A0A512IMP8_9HYPH|nr:hypothetical protein [Methylobacterium haplocladii]GEO98951.1 hypothetical protein MHA02_13390 [Methylobacterium haplocladii]GJD84202.1 hypothetical protein HPGCJGGD_2077 [Methylobacterium haplocladii]GLS59809.1 hypothetical protein GCM10007887_24820 [Methylobacterium haplocladii]